MTYVSGLPDRLLNSALGTASGISSKLIPAGEVSDGSGTPAATSVHPESVAIMLPIVTHLIYILVTVLRPMTSCIIEICLLHHLGPSRGHLSAFHDPGDQHGAIRAS